MKKKTILMLSIMLIICSIFFSACSSTEKKREPISISVKKVIESTEIFRYIGIEETVFASHNQNFIGVEVAVIANADLNNISYCVTFGTYPSLFNNLNSTNSPYYYLMKKLNYEDFIKLDTLDKDKLLRYETNDTNQLKVGVTANYSLMFAVDNKQRPTLNNTKFTLHARQFDILTNTYKILTSININ